MFGNKKLDALEQRIAELADTVHALTTDIAVIRQNQLASAGQVLNAAKGRKRDLQDLIDTFIETKMLKELELNGGQLSNESSK